MSIIKKTLNEFYFEIRIQFPTILEVVLSMLLPFCTTYVYEVAFSALMTIKAKYWSALKSNKDALHLQPRLIL